MWDLRELDAEEEQTIYFLPQADCLLQLTTQAPIVAS